MIISIVAIDRCEKNSLAGHAPSARAHKKVINSQNHDIMPLNNNSHVRDVLLLLHSISATYTLSAHETLKDMRQVGKQKRTETRSRTFNYCD
jgi:hypothetical protein